MHTVETPAPTPPSSHVRSFRSRVRLLVLTLALIVIGAWLVVLPGGLLGHSALVGYAVCHRIPERSFFLGGVQLPLCARCSGTYLGALTSFAVMYLMGRRRAANLPPVSVLIIFALFMLAWAFDGVNSYLTLLPIFPHLYAPHNWLRLATGMLEGTALAAIVLPIFNQTMWADMTGERSVRDVRELGLLVLAIAGVMGLVLSEQPLLLYPLSLLSAGSVLWMLTLINSLLATIAARKENRQSSWRQAAPMLIVGLALALVELATIDFGRAWLTQRFGLPF